MTVVLQPVLKGQPETTELVPNQPVLILCKGADTSLLAKVCSPPPRMPFLGALKNGPIFFYIDPEPILLIIGLASQPLIIVL